MSIHVMTTNPQIPLLASPQWRSWILSSTWTWLAWTMTSPLRGCSTWSTGLQFSFPRCKYWSIHNKYSSSMTLCLSSTWTEFSSLFHYCPTVPHRQHSIKVQQSSHLLFVHLHCTVVTVRSSHNQSETSLSPPLYPWRCWT